MTSKKLLRPGFSFIEVLIALMMLSVILPIFFSVQGTMQRMLTGSILDWRAVQILQKSYADLLKKEPLALGGSTTHTYDDYATAVSVGAPSQDSPLKKIAHVGLERTVVTDVAGHTYSLTRLVYRPPAEDKK